MRTDSSECLYWLLPTYQQLIQPPAAVLNILIISLLSAPPLWKPPPPPWTPSALTELYRGYPQLPHTNAAIVQQTLVPGHVLLHRILASITKFVTQRATSCDRHTSTDLLPRFWHCSFVALLLKLIFCHLIAVYSKILTSRRHTPWHYSPGTEAAFQRPVYWQVRQQLCIVQPLNYMIVTLLSKI